MLLSTNLAIPRRRPLVLGECMQLCDSLSTVKYLRGARRETGRSDATGAEAQNAVYMCVQRRLRILEKSLKQGDSEGGSLQPLT